MDSEPLILIIEDNIDSLSILRTSLEYENYKVVTALNENSVMEILEKYQPDLILQDLTIPNITYQKLKKIKLQFSSLSSCLQ